MSSVAWVSEDGAWERPGVKEEGGMEAPYDKAWSPKNSFLDRKQADWIEGWKSCKGPELPGDALYNCEFVYEAGLIPLKPRTIPGYYMPSSRIVPEQDLGFFEPWILYNLEAL